MLGTAVETLLKKQEKPYVVSDQEIDITNIERLNEFTENKSISWIINCAAYTAVDKVEDEQDFAFKINAEWPFNITQIIREKARNSSIYQLIMFLTAQKTALMRKEAI